MDAKHRIDCSKCDQRFLPEHLEQHMKTQHELPKEACSVCGKVVYQQVLAQHIDIFHKAECAVCRAKFLTNELQAHVKAVHEKEACRDCGDKFENKEKLRRHVATVHLEKCEECEERFKTKDLLGQHVEERHPKEECQEEDCDEVFPNKEKLEEHKEKKHPNPNKFMTFGGGMFMMMMVPDDEEKQLSEEEMEADDKEANENEEENKEEDNEDKSEEVVKAIILDLLNKMSLFNDKTEEAIEVEEETKEAIEVEDEAAARAVCRELVENICAKVEMEDMALKVVNNDAEEVKDAEEVRKVAEEAMKGVEEVVDKDAEEAVLLLLFAL